jgi:hypothetical protein
VGHGGLKLLPINAGAASIRALVERGVYPEKLFA